MEHMAQHSTNFEQAEGEQGKHKLSLERREKAPGRGVPRPLFAAVAVLAVALGALAAWLALCSRSSAQHQVKLLAQLDQEESTACLLREELEQTKTDLVAAQANLAQAQDTITLLEEYSVASPDGTVPEYTQLYPDFYAPARGEEEGEKTVKGGRVCCLTFDDGPSPNTERVLEILERYGVKGTFFVVGNSAATAAGQERMKKIVAAGHTLAMHSWSHEYKKVYASVDAFLEEFNSLYQWIHQVTGVYPAVYRFPGGSLNGYNRGVYQEIIAEMTRRGFVYYDWNASAQDATVHPRPAWDIAADCLRGVGRDLVVVLCHDSAARGTTVDALPAVIEGYQNAGYTFSALHPGVEQVTFGYPKIR